MCARDWSCIDGTLATMYRKTLCSTHRLSKSLREFPVDYKALLTGSYTVILTVGDTTQQMT